MVQKRKKKKKKRSGQSSSEITTNQGSNKKDQDLTKHKTDLKLKQHLSSKTLVLNQLSPTETTEVVMTVSLSYRCYLEV